EEGPCGWLKDRYGVSWQIVPSRMYELIADPDPERAQRAIAAMLQMGKIEIADLERAADGAVAPARCPPWRSSGSTSRSHWTATSPVPSRASRTRSGRAARRC